PRWIQRIARVHTMSRVRRHTVATTAAGLGFALCVAFAWGSTFALAATSAAPIAQNAQAAAQPAQAAAQNAQAAAQTQQPAEAVEVVPVVSKAVERQVKLPGEFQPYLAVPIVAKVSGFVKMITVDRGSAVKHGELLATLEAPEMQAQIIEAQSK